jgi:hypothetical protein
VTLTGGETVKTGSGFIIRAPEGTAIDRMGNVAIPAYASGAVNALCESGVIGGKPGNLFDPRGAATCAEAAVCCTGLSRRWGRNNAD